MEPIHQQERTPVTRRVLEQIILFLMEQVIPYQTELRLHIRPVYPLQLVEDQAGVLRHPKAGELTQGTQALLEEMADLNWVLKLEARIPIPTPQEPITVCQRTQRRVVHQAGAVDHLKGGQVEQAIPLQMEPVIRFPMERVIQFPMEQEHQHPMESVMVTHKADRLEAQCLIQFLQGFHPVIRLDTRIH